MARLDSAMILESDRQFKTAQFGVTGKRNSVLIVVIGLNSRHLPRIEANCDELIS
jgi:hypothetical protein